ncbi:MAG TPA: hypothetical protein VLL54_18985 [Pyrinomonadaceae bacterium]|nr:hypothetical protein [Pyrinomonadaceae bacterium]
MKKTLIAVCILIVVGLAVNGQLRPGQRGLRRQPNTPPQNQTATPAAESNTAPQPTAAASGGTYVDDGFSWFEAKATEALGQNNIPYSTGWVLKSHVRVIGEFPNRSAIKLVVARGSNPIATTRCEVDVYRKGPNDVDQSYMWTNECWRKDTATKEIGNFDLKVFTVNGDTDEEKLVRTYKIEVRTVNHVLAGQHEGVAPPDYFIQRHAEAPVSFIFLRPSGYTSYFEFGSRPERSGANLVELYFNLSPSDIGRDLPQGYMRCSVDGKRLSMPGPMPYADQAISRAERSFVVIYQDRIAPQYKRGTEYRDEIGFRMVRLKAPLTWGSVRDTNRLALEDYPGNWECSLMNNGEVWRTWRWKIGSDGMPGLHPEQKGNINLYFNSFLVNMEIPAGGSPLDQRLVPSATSNGFFYGQPWTSAEGRAMAARLPKKGNPYPVPSNLVK